ncbi:unannotated protein [freshwater metagenome]|uniref:Unannotated protein n=1 Tax=freshwater metagenome TaxID=449393 RepID=A0A6J5Z2F5_9ZZZZ
MQSQSSQPPQDRRHGDRRNGDRRVAGGEHSGPTLTVMIVDDETLVRSALAALLRKEPGIEIVAQPADIDAAAQAANGHKPDIILFDPLADASVETVAEEIGQLLEASPESKTIVLSNREDAAFARAVLFAGAVGYMLTREDPEDLLKAILRASKGHPSVSPTIAILIAQADTQNGDGDLTDREKEVLQLVALGHTSNEIAAQLFLSARTVESHRANMIRKLGVENRAGLVRYALDNDLVS